MSLTKDDVRKVAFLARIRVPEDQLDAMAADLNNLIGWVEQLAEVDTDGVAPMTGAVGTSLPMRADAVTDGGDADRVLANAPDRAGNYYAVPKVVE